MEMHVLATMAAQRGRMGFLGLRKKVTPNLVA